MVVTNAVLDAFCESAPQARSSLVCAHALRVLFRGLVDGVKAAMFRFFCRLSRLVNRDACVAKCYAGPPHMVAAR